MTRKSGKWHKSSFSVVDFLFWDKLIGNPQFESIHKKFFPLMLDYTDSNLIDAWLNPCFTDSNAIEYLLTNKIPQGLMASPIASTRHLKFINEPKIIQNEP